MGSEAEVVRESRPEVPPCPEMWVVQFWDPVPKRWRVSVEFYNSESFGRANWSYQPHRIIRIPSESPATKRGEEFVDAVRELNKACFQMRDNWAESDAARQNELWSRVHRANAAVFEHLSKESPCSSGSQGGGCGGSASAPTTTSPPASLASASSSNSGPSSPSSSNPPAWATPQILAACKPGDELRYDKNLDFVNRFSGPDRTMSVDWYSCKEGAWRGEPGSPAASCDRDKDESYTIPTPPPDKPKPEAKCDGSGKIIIDASIVGALGWVPCPGCPACKPKCDSGLTCGGPLKCQPCAARVEEKHGKPKPDDAEEVARKATTPWALSLPMNALSSSDIYRLESAIAAAIRADRQKHADLAGKVVEP